LIAIYAQIQSPLDVIWPAITIFMSGDGKRKLMSLGMEQVTDITNI